MDNQMNNGGFNTEIKNEIKGRGLFYGVIAVATFIVMAVGATFAYFTATTSSANTSVQTGSTTLQLKYISYETGWLNGDLIPVDTDTAAYSFEMQDDTTLGDVTKDPSANLLCKDDYGNSICSAYVFQITNSANSPQTLSLSVVSELNEFENLNAMAFEVAINPSSEDYNNTDGEDGNGANDPKFKLSADQTGEDYITVVDGSGLPAAIGSFTPIYINRKGVVKTMLKYTEGDETSDAKEKKLKQVVDSSTNTSANLGDRTMKIANNFEIGGGETRTYALVLYILDNGRDQTNSDADKDFYGQVIVNSGEDGGGVSGFIQAVDDLKNKGQEDNGDDLTTE